MILCSVLVENLEFCIFCRYIFIFPASTHSASQQRHLTTHNVHHPHTVCISVLYSLLLSWVINFSYLYYREMHLRTYIHWYFPLTYNNSPIFIICYIKISRNFTFLTNIKYVHLWYFQTQLFCSSQRSLYTSIFYQQEQVQKPNACSTNQATTETQSTIGGQLIVVR